MLSDKILVRPDKADEVRASGLILPGSTKHFSNIGDVIGVGPGLTTSAGALIVPEVKPGDRVCWTKHTGIEVTVDNEVLIVLTPREVTCKLQREAA